MDRFRYIYEQLNRIRNINLRIKEELIDQKLRFPSDYKSTLLSERIVYQLSANLYPIPDSVINRRGDENIKISESGIRYIAGSQRLNLKIAITYLPMFSY